MAEELSDAPETPEAARIPARDERNAATSFRDNGGGEPSEAEARNGRANDLTIRQGEPVLPNSTLASRAAHRKRQEGASTKQVSAADDEEVQDKGTRRRGRKAAG